MSRVNFNETTLKVDDTDNGIVYSNDFKLVPSGDYNSTIHCAWNAGDTATFKFSGTGIEVWGPMGSILYSGQPVTTYSIDGQVKHEYTAPFIPDGYHQSSLAYFVSPPLADGEHTLVVTNLNGTAPSTYNLDFILFTPSTASTTDGTTSSATTPGQGSGITDLASASLLTSVTGSKTANGVSGSPTSNTPGIGTTSVIHATPMVSGIPISAVSRTPTAVSSILGAPTTSSAKSPAHTAPVGAIVGGIVGGLGVLALVIGIVVWLRQRRVGSGPVEIEKQRNFRDSDVVPFPSTISPPPGRSKASSFMDGGRSTTTGPLVMGAYGVSPEGYVGSASPRQDVRQAGDQIPAWSHLDRQPSLSSATVAPPFPPATAPDARQVPTGQQHVDSGIRISMQQRLVDIPPVYSQE